MTEKEALKLALEALKYPLNQAHENFNVDMAELLAHRAITAIEEALAQPEQEPVAWIHNHIKGNVIAHRPATLDRHPDHWTALYPEPKPCPTCEALARTVMLDQTSHDTTPPQRKPLTDEQILHLVDIHVGAPSTAYPLDTSDWLCFARAIEQAHGIKGEQ